MLTLTSHIISTPLLIRKTYNMIESKLDFLDAELTADDAQLRQIAQDVSRADVQALLESEAPNEAKASKLLGLIRLLTDTERDELREFAKSALAKIDPPLSIDIPQITS